MQDKIWERFGRMCDVLREHHRVGSVVNGRATFLGWSNDTLRTCAFGSRLDLLDDPEQALAFHRMLKAFAAFYPVLKQCGWMVPLCLKMPIAPFQYIYTPLAAFLTVHLVQHTLSHSSLTWKPSYDVNANVKQFTTGHDQSRREGFPRVCGYEQQ